MRHSRSMSEANSEQNGVCKGTAQKISIGVSFDNVIVCYLVEEERVMRVVESA